MLDGRVAHHEPDGAVAARRVPPPIWSRLIATHQERLASLNLELALLHVGLEAVERVAVEPATAGILGGVLGLGPRRTRRGLEQPALILGVAVPEASKPAQVYIFGRQRSGRRRSGRGTVWERW